MKTTELPESFTSSNIIGEMFAWNLLTLLTLLIEEIPELSHKEKILETIEEQQKTLLHLEI